MTVKNTFAQWKILEYLNEFIANPLLVQSELLIFKYIFSTWKVFHMESVCMCGDRVTFAFQPCLKVIKSQSCYVQHSQTEGCRQVWAL